MYFPCNQLFDSTVGGQVAVWLLLFSITYGVAASTVKLLMTNGVM
jgi:hypothetical protein